MRGAEPTEPRDDRAVVGVDVGDEPVGPSGPCCGHRLLEEARADALSLSGVGDLPAATAVTDKDFGAMIK